MQCWHRRDCAFFRLVDMPSATDPHNSLVCSQQMPRRYRTQKYEKVGVGELDVAMQKGKAGGRFFRRRIAVLRRTPGKNVRDVNLRPVETDRLQHFVQKLAGAAHEGQTLSVFVTPRCFADQHDTALRVSVGKYGIGRAAFEFASIEGLEGVSQFGKRSAGGGQGAGRAGRRGQRDGFCACRDAAGLVLCLPLCGRGGLYGLRGRIWPRKPIRGLLADRLAGAGLHEPAQSGKVGFLIGF